MKQTTSKSKSKKRNECKIIIIIINRKQERMKEDSTQGGYEDLQACKQHRGGEAPRPKNRIRHHGEHESERKSEEDLTRNKREATKRKRKGKTENGIRERKNEENNGKEKKARVSGRYFANYLGLIGGDAA